MAECHRKPAVLLISPGVIKWTDMDFGLPHLVSIGGYLQTRFDARVEVIDLGHEGGDHGHLARLLESLAPFLLIGVSCYSSFDHMRVRTLGAFLKRLYPDVPIITGGYHPSALPDDFLFEGSPFDGVVVGEGELAMASVVEQCLGGGLRDRMFSEPPVRDLDSLPPYQWDLLRRYWPRALHLGRKLQIYLSRGCPYQCTFCMERVKGSASNSDALGAGMPGGELSSRWRAFSPERAVDELRRLSRVTPLEAWLINIADPLFGFQRSWRRTVLEAIIREGLIPRQYWTLTRADDLEEVDIELLARARFSIGIGIESGSPEMLGVMRKTRAPDAYLAALERLVAGSRRHRLTWAGNIIVGHPGETPETLSESIAFVERLFTSSRETCGWLSIDPFRLYPGSHVFEHMSEYEARFGTTFHHPDWWRRWYNEGFLAEHIDPGRTLDYEARVRAMYAGFGPLVRQISDRFRGQGRAIDRSFERSIRDQVDP